MLTRHSNELYSRLERVEDIGCAEIRKNELLTWYSQERLTSSIWRDVQEKWGEVSDKTLLVGDTDGVWVLAYGEGLTASEDAWFQPVEVRAKQRSTKK